MPHAFNIKILKFRTEETTLIFPTKISNLKSLEINLDQTFIFTHNAHRFHLGEMRKTLKTPNEGRKRSLSESKYKFYQFFIGSITAGVSFPLFSFSLLWDHLEKTQQQNNVTETRVTIPKYWISPNGPWSSLDSWLFMELKLLNLLSLFSILGRN